MSNAPKKILLLGGTTEAREISEVLANCDDTDAVISLAGRTSTPPAFMIPLRVGGFGGIDGLASYLQDNGVDLLINATHPYANQIAFNAVAASKKAGVPLISIRRPAWTPAKGDRWTMVEDGPAIIRALGRRKARNVFLPLGQKELHHFEAAPRHNYLIRTVEPVGGPLKLPKAKFIQERPPFTKASEIELMTRHKIDVMVMKNSGGSASYPKILAARELGIEVIVLERPKLPDVPVCRSVAEVVMSVHELGLRVKRVA